MRCRLFSRFVLILPTMLLAAGVAWSAQVVSTTARGVPAVMQAGGFMLQPVGNAPASYNDLAPRQLFEITRPGNQAFTIGRLFTSCTCVRLEAESRSFGPGERAVVSLRNVMATPPGGQNYALYVQITSPIQATLRYDTYVQSSQFVPSPDVYQPTRGNIVSDGVLEPVYYPISSSSSTVSAPVFAGADIEMIVPKADHYEPDNSEYTLRKKAEEEAAAKSKDASTPDKDTAKSGVPSGSVEEEKETAKADDHPDMAGKAPGPAVDKAEEAVAETGRAAAESSQITVDDVADRARSEAETAARLTADQDETLQEGAKIIGGDTANKERSVASAASNGAEKAEETIADSVEKIADAGEKAVAGKGDPLWGEVAPKANSVERGAEGALESAGATAASAVDSEAKAVAAAESRAEEAVTPAEEPAMSAVSASIDAVKAVVAE